MSLCQLIDSGYAEAKYDIGVFFSETTNYVGGTITYARDIFDESTIVRMSEHIVMVFDEIFIEKKSDVPIGELSNLLVSEKEQIEKMNSTDVDWGVKEELMCVPDRLFEIVKKQPNAACLWLEDGTCMTYGQFHEKVMKLAVYLQKRGLKTEEIVGLCFENSLYFVVGAWSVMCAGGAYCPFDPENPKERQEFLMKDTRTKIVLTESKLKSKWNEMSTTEEEVHVVFVDEER